MPKKTKGVYSMKKNYEQPQLEKDLFQEEDLLSASVEDENELIGSENDGILNDVYNLL